MAWARLIRFVDDSGRTVFGEPCKESAEELTSKFDQGELYALEVVRLLLVCFAALRN